VRNSSKKLVFCGVIECNRNTAHNAGHSVKSISLIFCAVEQRVDSIGMPVWDIREADTLRDVSKIYGLAEV